MKTIILLLALVVSAHTCALPPVQTARAAYGTNAPVRLGQYIGASAEINAEEAAGGRLARFMDEIFGALIDEFLPERLTEKEIELIKAHPLAALQVNRARNIADTVTKGLFGERWRTEDTRENAFRHCLWNALMAYLIGPELAKQFGDAHEYGMLEKYPENTKMDLYNNSIGYILGTEPFSESELDAAAQARRLREYGEICGSNDMYVYIITERVYRALEDGTLYWFRD
ncbi:MAG: hypothetical protein IKR85_05335 [Clostridia bacterium]|nr:hypothetical protein [Clostridia bacterium]